MAKSNKHLLLDILLVREYFKTGTNGTLYINGEKHSHTIELPWKNNQSQVSCIPEGRYQVVKRYSQPFGHHLQLINVPGRDLILIHPANNAVKELKGCIAPVTTLTAPGCGNQSRNVFEPLRDKLYTTLNEALSVFITITSIKEIEQELKILGDAFQMHKKRPSLTSNLSNDKN